MRLASYPEFKGYYGNVRWAQFGTSQGLITAVLGGDAQFLQVFTPALPSSSVGSATCRIRRPACPF